MENNNNFDDFDSEFDREFSDENGNFDIDKYKKYLSDIYESLSGKREEDIFDKLDIDNMDIRYPSDISDEESQIRFMNFVSNKDLNITFTENAMNDVTMVSEEWTSEDSEAVITRTYEYNHDTISLLDESIKKLIYDKMIKRCLENENYEEAAKIRDIELKNKNKNIEDEDND